MYKTNSSLAKLTTDRTHSHSKSMNNFVLLNQNRQIQSNYQWKPLQIKQALIQRTNSLNREISHGPSYAHKKSILLTLNQPNQNQLTNTPKHPENISPSKKSISTQVFLKSKLNLTHKPSTTQSSDVKFHDLDFIRPAKNMDRMRQKLDKFTSTATFFNQKVQKNIMTFKESHINRQSFSKKGLQSQKPLQQRVKQAHQKGQRVISVLTMKRYGLRIRLKQCFVEVCMCSKSLHQNEHRLENNEKINNLVREMLSIHNAESKTLYFFHLNKEPLVLSDDLPISQSVILASTSPVLTIENEFHFKVYEEAERINSLIKQTQLSLGITERHLIQRKTKSLYQKSRSSFGGKGDHNEQQEMTQIYDWQKISDVNNFVQQLVENPEYFKSLNRTQELTASEKQEIRKFYNESFDTLTKPQTGENFRNPLLEDHSHYHIELTKKKMLGAISTKLQDKDFIRNDHILKRPTIEALIEEDKREKQREIQEIKNPNIINRNIRNTQKTKKSIIRLLDEKNPLLFEQNIPYLLDKYGISRYEIHNLFTIYKTLQKISAMKYKDQNNANKVYNKGIDRSTFDEGMKRLDINPGDEVIKNICYFDDFISWEHFLKIVSIGLRKTPEEKLQAILIGIGGTNNGCLSRNQISLMIGNSLNKIFDSEQTELREYFTDMAMKDLDADGSGTVDVEEIKKKCLVVSQINTDNGETMDLITFLLLNS